MLSLTTKFGRRGPFEPVYLSSLHAGISSTIATPMYFISLGVYLSSLHGSISSTITTPMYFISLVYSMPWCLFPALDPDMGGRQNCGRLFLDPLNTWRRIILRTQTGTIVLTTTHIGPEDVLIQSGARPRILRLAGIQQNLA